MTSFDCVKTREKPFRDIELAINTVAVSHLGIIAYNLQRSLKWDAEKQEFTGDDGSQSLPGSCSSRTLAALGPMVPPNQSRICKINQEVQNVRPSL